MKIKKYKIKTSFVSPKWLKARAKKGINFVIFILIFVENCLQYDAMHDFIKRFYLYQRCLFARRLHTVIMLVNFL